MRLLAPLVACFAFTLSSSTFLFAQGQDDTFRKDVMKLLDLTGSTKIGVQMATLVSGQFLDGMKKANPSVPGKAIDLAKELLNEEFAKAFESPDGLTPQLIPIYMKHFTHEEVLGLIRFYETELGRKTVSVMPQVMQEAAGVGQAWAEANIPRILGAINDRLRAEGFIK